MNEPIKMTRDEIDRAIAQNRDRIGGYAGHVEIKDLDLGLLWKQVEWVEEQTKYVQSAPEREWYQGDWAMTKHDEQNQVCGTYRCVAGNVALMFGTEVMDQDTNQTVSIVQTDDGNFWSMAMLAQVKLGITPGWAEQLFSGGNTATSVRRIAESITKAACEEWYRE